MNPETVLPIQSSLINEPSRATLLEDLHFLPVPNGNATLGLDEKVAERFVNSYGEVWQDFFCREMPQHETSIEAFSLGRYPVTNGIYALFIADGGYDRAELWTPDGWAWRINTQRTQPLYWNDPKFIGQDRPVVGVSWYEAIALARWAALTTGQNVRLPNEAEWEWASRSTNNRSLYPWGGVWDANKLNSGVADNGKTTLGSTSPVGAFSPIGDAPFGHADMLGQVWEWTSSIYRSYPYDAKDGREDLYTPERRILRGGNWSDGKYANRVTTRYLYHPHYSDATTGVRLALGGSAFIPPRGQYDLVLYGRSTFCPDLVKTKNWLHAWHVPYRQVNIDQDEQAALRLDQWLGSRTIPTLVIAPINGTEPITTPNEVDLTKLRNMDRGSMMHEPEEGGLHAFLVRHGFIQE